MKIVNSASEVEQPGLYQFASNDLTVAIASLSIGGAEKIVLDWAARVSPQWKITLIVLRNRENEWSVPSRVNLVRLADPEIIKAAGLENLCESDRLLALLRNWGRELSAKLNSVCVCHLLSQSERDALAAGGAKIVNVLHNAKEGWSETIERLTGSFNTIAVSQSCASDLRVLGYEGPVSVIRHIPGRINFRPGIREQCRKAWNIPVGATVIGMIGAVKSQKNYLRALHVLKALRSKHDAYLVILGGPLIKGGREQWTSLVEESVRIGVRDRLCMPGFVPNASEYLTVFDIVLNTSFFEGLSIATLEALVNQFPVVASEVGGQGEISSEGLTLLSLSSSDDVWADAIIKSLSTKFETPFWATFGSFRLWTLAGLARPFVSEDKLLFVTANLNSGGAQRSLVNLAASLAGLIDFEVVVAGNSTDDYFYRKLASLGIRVSRLRDTNDSFANAEALVDKICSEKFGTVCFWNLDPKIELLAVKALEFGHVRFLDVSPGNYSFEGISDVREYQDLIAFSEKDYYRRLDQLVLKYRGPYPEPCKGKVSIIRNGVPKPLHTKADYSIKGIPKVVVNGRIAPTKFVIEIAQAMRLVRERFPGAELHIYGGVEPLQMNYHKEVLEDVKDEIEKVVFFHGVEFEAMEKLAPYDAYVVLGKNQGCPNALLEALAVGLPAIANDDGGTGEQIIHNKTGLLVSSCDPAEVAEAITKILADRSLAERLGREGRARVRRMFSMEKMRRQYMKLLAGKKLAVSTGTRASVRQLVEASEEARA
jgi:glycosyltransferase involved in cell wall biosynthesis